MPTERADARRNRLLVLDAARRLFEDRGVEDVTMEDVALAAGVGKGTVYRRFHDRYGLACAVEEHQHAALLRSLQDGTGTFAPDVPAADRAVRLALAVLALQVQHLDAGLALESGRPGGRSRTPVYAQYLRYLESCLEHEGSPSSITYLAVVLLELSNPVLVARLLREQRWPQATLTRCTEEQARALLRRPPAAEREPTAED